MRPFTIDIDPAAVDADGIAANNDSSNATSGVTIDGVLTSGGVFAPGDGLGYQLSITDTATLDQTSATFTLTGTDVDGFTLTEAVAGPNSTATVESAGYFATLTEIAVASPVANGTVNVGTVDEVVSKSIPLNGYAQIPMTIQADVTGTIDYDVQLTYDPAINQHTRTTQDALKWIVDANWDGKTADQVKALATTGALGMRIVVNSYTDTAEIQFYCVQPNN